MQVQTGGLIYLIFVSTVALIFLAFLPCVNLIFNAAFDITATAASLAALGGVEATATSSRKRDETNVNKTTPTTTHSDASVLGVTVVHGSIDPKEHALGTFRRALGMQIPVPISDQWSDSDAP